MKGCLSILARIYIWIHYKSALNINEMYIKNPVIAYNIS